MLEAVFPIDAIPAGKAARICIDLINSACDRSSDEVYLYDRQTQLESIESELDAKSSFNLRYQSCQVQLAAVSNHNLSFLVVDGIARRSKDKWIDAFSRQTAVVSARGYDADYDYWQNAEDPLEFSSAGRSIAGLTLKSNGLPPPLNQRVVDTSKNPGRRILRSGYIEAIGDEMWLGHQFFLRVPGASLASIRAVDWLDFEERQNNIVKIRDRAGPFKSEATAERQLRLRNLLFPVVPG